MLLTSEENQLQELFIGRLATALIQLKPLYTIPKITNGENILQAGLHIIPAFTEKISELINEQVVDHIVKAFSELLMEKLLHKHTENPDEDGDIVIMSIKYFYKTWKNYSDVNSEIIHPHLRTFEYDGKTYFVSPLAKKDISYSSRAYVEFLQYHFPYIEKENKHSYKFMSSWIINTQ